MAMDAPYELGDSVLPLVATAVHAGHQLRPEMAERIDNARLATL